MARLTHKKHRALVTQQRGVLKESLATVAYKRAARANVRHRSSRQRELGQFLTPTPVAELMASMFVNSEKDVRLLDAGAGAGSLIQAFVETRCAVRPLPAAIHVVAYEVDASLLAPLRRTLENCRQHCLSAGVHFTADVQNVDFIEAALPLVRGDLLSGPQTPFNAAILNPP